MAIALQALGMTRDGRSVRVFEDLPAPAPTTVRALVAAVGPEVALLVAEGAAVLVNGERASLDSAVADGDEVSIVTAVAGG